MRPRRVARELLLCDVTRRCPETGASSAVMICKRTNQEVAVVPERSKRPSRALEVLEQTCLCERSKRLLAEVQRAGANRANVLLLGETGVGKEVVSRALHEPLE